MTEIALKDAVFLWNTGADVAVTTQTYGVRRYEAENGLYDNSNGNCDSNWTSADTAGRLDRACDILCAMVDLDEVDLAKAVSAFQVIPEWREAYPTLSSIKNALIQRRQQWQTRERMASSGDNG